MNKWIHRDQDIQFLAWPWLWDLGEVLNIVEQVFFLTETGMVDDRIFEETSKSKTVNVSLIAIISYCAKLGLGGY